MLSLTETDPIALSLRGVQLRFPTGVVALQSLDLDVRQGEFLSLLGPSGCGKSTALRLAAGLIAPTHGQVTRSPSLQLGFVFQEPTLMPWATVFDNVRLPLRLQGRSAASVRDEVMQVLARVGLGEFEGAYPRELSGGMRMRASIARALVTRPKLLLLDEPFAALDEITRGRLDDDLLRIWQEQGLTVIFVTHNVYEAVYLSTRVAVFSGRPGRIIESLEIKGPSQRDDAFRATPHYVERCVSASAALRRAQA
jgi:NitT/TauT family transport system ATP-binding protein